MDFQYTSGPVPLEDIESQLRAPRRQTGARALTLNLICAAADAADAAGIPARLEQLGTRHPARVFLLTGRGSQGTGWSVAPAAQGCEYLYLEAAPAAAASLIAPLLNSDLPTLLWWRAGDPATHAEYAALCALAGRVVIDSQQLALPPQRLAALGKGAPLTDLSWARLTPWRQLLCQAVEAHPRSAYLDRVSAVNVATDDGQPNLAAALMAGWLAHQMEWRPLRRISATELRLERARGGGPPLTLSTAHARGKCKSALQAFELRSGDGGDGIQLRHHGGHVQLTLHDGGGMVGEWTGATAGDSLLRSEPDMLNEEFSITEADRLFQGALDRGLELLDLWGAAAA